MVVHAILHLERELEINRLLSHISQGTWVSGSCIALRVPSHKGRSVLKVRAGRFPVTLLPRQGALFTCWEPQCVPLLPAQQEPGCLSPSWLAGLSTHFPFHLFCPTKHPQVSFSFPSVSVSLLLVPLLPVLSSGGLLHAKVSIYLAEHKSPW